MLGGELGKGWGPELGPCSATSKVNGRTWKKSATPANSNAADSSTTPCGYTPASAMSLPTTSTPPAVRASAKPAATGSPRPAKHGSTTVKPQPRNTDEIPVPGRVFHRPTGPLTWTHLSSYGSPVETTRPT